MKSLVKRYEKNPILTKDDVPYPVATVHNAGVAKFDEQHKALIQMINRLHDAMKAGRARSELKAILESLASYTAKHFLDEERVMQIHGYTGLDRHKEQHNEFAERVKEIVKQHEKGETVLSMDIMTMLQDWLVKHILGTDKTYSDFFKERRVV